jgi:hypothetical protein
MTLTDEESGYEPVFTMTDYYDGPRAGIASFSGKPHAYASPPNFYEEGFDDFYQLRPVDDETLRLALEDWEIWLRWEAASYAGLAPIETHPALPEDRARHDHIAPLLAARLAALPGPAICARAVFRSMTDQQGGRRLEVKWTVEPANRP